MTPKDTHALVFHESEKTYSGLVVNGVGYRDAGKMSNLHDVVVEDSIFIGGIEDCLNINRCQNIELHRCVFKDPRRYALTIKGGARRVILCDCSFMGRKPENCHIEIGQYSDYELSGIRRTTNIQLINCDCDSGPITTKIWRGDKVITMGSPVTQTEIPNIIRWIYFTFRKCRQLYKYGSQGRNNACLFIND